MQKHLQKLLLIVAMMVVPWVAHGQMLSEYVFSTGVDTSRWIPMGSPTYIWSTYQDDVASSVYNLGFTFPFGEDAYSQFSVSSNGIFKLGSSTASSGTTAGQFTSSYYNTSLPKICGIARDLGTGSNGYVRYEMTGTAPNRVFVCEFAMGYTYGSSYTGDVKWQVQLHEDSSKVVIVYGPDAPSNTPSSFQTGLAEVSNDIIIINPSTHQPIYCTGAYSTTYSTWHGAGRYYEFVRPVISCPRPTEITVGNLDVTGFDISWTDSSDALTWLVQLVTSDSIWYDNVEYSTTVSFTALDANTDYTVRVAGMCQNGDTSTWRMVNVHTLCGYLDSLPFTEDFETRYTTGSSSTGSPFIECWHRLNNGTSYGGYPYVSNSTTYNHTLGGSNGLYWYNTTTTGTYGDYQCVVLPGVDTDIYPINSLMLVFWAKASSTSYSPVLQVGVLSDPTDVTTFQQVATVNVGNSAAWNEYSVALNNFEGYGSFVAVMAQRSSWTMYVDDFRLDVLPDCARPLDFQLVSTSLDSVIVSWSDTSENNAWQLVIGESGFDPDTVTDGFISVTDTVYGFDNLVPGVIYDIYVRADCYDEYSWWAGPLTVSPGAINMPYTGSMTVSMCGGVIYDNGGPSGSYSDNCNGQVIIYPSSPDSLVRVQGTFAGEGCCDYLGIYDGAGTSGTQLFYANCPSSGSTMSVGPFTSVTGPITITFTSDGSVNYPGFALSVSCVAAPECTDLASLSLHSVGTTSAYVQWAPQANATFGIPSSYELNCVDSTGASVFATTTTDLNYFFMGLMPNERYKVYVRTVCTEGNGNWDSVSFTTLAMPCLEWDTAGSGPTEIVAVGTDGTSTTYYMPINEEYNYSYFQSLIRTSEISLTGPATISGIGFQYAYTQPMTQITNCSIYMAHTTQTTLDNFVPYSDLQLVYTGPMNCTTPGWNFFQFNEGTFNFNGVNNMVVAVVNNSGAHESTSYTFYYHVPGVVLSRRVYGSSPYNSSNMSVSGNGSNWRCNMRLQTGGGDCLIVSSCATPHIIIDSVGATSAHFIWAPGGSETSWLIEYKESGDPNWTVEGTSSANDYTLTGLTANTEYNLRLTSLCTDSNYSTTLTFRTTCMPESLPFTENFESWSTANQWHPSCWYSTSTYSTSYPYVSTSYAHSGNHSMYFYNYSSYYAYVALPVMNAAIDSLQISFWIYKPNSSYSHALVVGVMEDPTDMATFVEVATAAPTSTNVWEPFEIPLNNYAGNGRYIAIKTTSGYCYPYLDDIEVAYISPCPRVRNVSSHGATATQAVITWDTTAALEYEVEYGPTGFARGTGTFVGSITDDSLVVTGLRASSIYDVYVRGICTPDTGNWSFAYTFNTQCGLIDSVPYYNSFNTLTSSDQVPHCWYTASTYDSYYPYVDSYEDRWGSGQSLYMYLYDGSSYYTMIQLPEIDTNVLPINTLQLEFSCLNSYGTGGFIVGVCTAQGMVGFTPIDTVTVPSDYNWYDYEVPLVGYSGYGSFITLKQYTTPSGDNDMYLDEVRLITAPTCIRPRSIRAMTVTTTDALVRWVPADSTQNEFEIRYGRTGCNVDTLTPNYVTGADSLLLTGLDSGVVYDVFVRAICTPGDSSFWTSNSFRTLASSPVSHIPYFCDFTGAEGLAWNRENGSQTNGWYLGTAAHYGTADNLGLYVSQNSGTSNSYDGNSTSHTYAYRTFLLTAGSYNISFSWMANGEGGSGYAYDYLRAFLAPAGDQIIAGQCPDGTSSSYSFWNVTPNGWISLDNSTPLRGISTWQINSQDVSVPVTGTYNLVFYWGNDGSVTNDPPAAIDNVEIARNTCRVANVRQDPAYTASDHQLHITWDTCGADYYEVAYGTPGFIPSGSFITAYTNTATINGLSALTNYDVCVRGICDAGADTGRWVRASFQTAMCDNAGIVQNWDSTASSSTTSYGPIGYSCYNYSYTQIIIDSAKLASLNGDITAFQFKPSNSASEYGTYYTNMDIYMANISESVFSNGFIMPDTTTHRFVQVMSNGNCNYTSDDWQTIGLDTTFAWDGHSNLLVAFNRRHGSYSCSAEYECHSTSGNKMIYVYNDDSAYNINTVSGGTTTNNVGDLKLISCGVVGCRQPVVTGITHTYESATVSWSGTGTEYEVNVKESMATNWPATDIHVTGNSYTFTGLQPTTNYTFRVRQDCTADSLGYSDWTVDGFLTDSLPCLPPDSLTASNVTNATATFDWTPFGYETMWDIHVWYSGGLDTVYTVSTHPVTVGGFTPGVTYSASVRPLCGSAHNILGDYGDTITFTTAVCPDVTGLTVVGTPTANSVTLSWSSNPAAQGWEIEYGYAGFQVGTGTMATTTTPGYTANGLLDETTYEFHVRTVCGTGWYSENWTSVTATTASGAIPCDAPTGVNTVVAGNSATVSWTTETGNISFEVEYGPHGFSHGGGTTVNATASPITIYNLDYETQYDVYVRAICAQNTISAWSIVSSFTTDEAPSQDCDPVSNLAADNVTKLTAHITWTPGATGDAWQVLLTDAAGATVMEDRVTATDYSFTGLTPGTQYVAKVRTDCGDNQYSAYVSVSFTTQPQEGIDEVGGAQCAIYPNPTSSSATISVTGVNGKVKIAVVDMNGREVRSETLECTNDCEKTMDVENLAQGAYFVRITGENVNMVRKLVVR